jgi:hypothetical protein
MDITSVVSNRALELIRAGVDPDVAIDTACREYRGLAGLGDDPPTDPSLLNQAQSSIQSISTSIAPYLWIMSVIGFIMGVMNKAEITKMYGSWKRAKQKLLGG